MVVLSLVLLLAQGGDARAAPKAARAANKGSISPVVKKVNQGANVDLKKVESRTMMGPKQSANLTTHGQPDVFVKGAQQTYSGTVSGKTGLVQQQSPDFSDLLAEIARYTELNEQMRKDITAQITENKKLEKDLEASKKSFSDVKGLQSGSRQQCNAMDGKAVERIGSLLGFSIGFSAVGIVAGGVNIAGNLMQKGQSKFDEEQGKAQAGEYNTLDAACKELGAERLTKTEFCARPEIAGIMSRDKLVGDAGCTEMARRCNLPKAPVDDGRGACNDKVKKFIDSSWRPTEDLCTDAALPTTAEMNTCNDKFNDILPLNYLDNGKDNSRQKWNNGFKNANILHIINLRSETSANLNPRKPRIDTLWNQTRIDLLDFCLDNKAEKNSGFSDKLKSCLIDLYGVDWPVSGNSAVVPDGVVVMDGNCNATINKCSIEALREDIAWADEQTKTKIQLVVRTDAITNIDIAKIQRNFMALKTKLETARTECLARNSDREKCLQQTNAWWNASANVCNVCTGIQKVNANKTACEACPAGQMPNQSGNACQPCPDGHSRAANATSCTPCGQGMTHNPNRDGCVPSDDTLRTNCLQKTYAWWRESDRQCFECASPQIVNKDRSACVNCPSGQERNSAGNGCTPTQSTLKSECENQGPNRLWDGTQCTTCPSGQVRNSAGTGCVALPPATCNSLTSEVSSWSANSTVCLPSGSVNYDGLPNNIKQELSGCQNEGDKANARGTIERKCAEFIKEQEQKCLATANKWWTNNRCESCPQGTQRTASSANQCVNAVVDDGFDAWSRAQSPDGPVTQGKCFGRTGFDSKMGWTVNPKTSPQGRVGFLQPGLSCLEAMVCLGLGGNSTNDTPCATYINNQLNRGSLPSGKTADNLLYECRQGRGAIVPNTFCGSGSPQNNRSAPPPISTTPTTPTWWEKCVDVVGYTKWQDLECGDARGCSPTGNIHVACNLENNLNAWPPKAKELYQEKCTQKKNAYQKDGGCRQNPAPVPQQTQPVSSGGGSCDDELDRIKSAIRGISVRANSSGANGIEGPASSDISTLQSYGLIKQSACSNSACSHGSRFAVGSTCYCSGGVSCLNGFMLTPERRFGDCFVDRSKIPSACKDLALTLPRDMDYAEAAPARAVPTAFSAYVSAYRATFLSAAQPQMTAEYQEAYEKQRKINNAGKVMSIVGGAVGTVTSGLTAASSIEILTKLDTLLGQVEACRGSFDAPKAAVAAADWGW